MYKGSLLVLFVLLRAPKPHDHGKSFHVLGAIGKPLMNMGA
jgi:hypothetical protein